MLEIQPWQVEQIKCFVHNLTRKKLQTLEQKSVCKVKTWFFTYQSMIVDGPHKYIFCLDKEVCITEERSSVNSFITCNSETNPSCEEKKDFQTPNEQLTTIVY